MIFPINKGQAGAQATRRRRFGPLLPGTLCLVPGFIVSDRRSSALARTALHERRYDGRVVDQAETDGEDGESRIADLHSADDRRYPANQPPPYGAGRLI